MSPVNNRISNISREELSNLWKTTSAEQLNELISISNEKELDLLFGHLPEQAVSVILNQLSDQNLNKVFSFLPSRTINKVLMFAGNKTLSRLPKQLDKNILFKILKYLSSDHRERILRALPQNERKLLMEISEEESDLDKDYKYYLSEKFENSLEREALSRIKEIEEKERYMERRLRAREEQYSAQIEHLRNQAVDLEKDLHIRQNKYKNTENEFLKREIDLKDRIRALQEEHQKQVKEKIEIKVPEFVRSAISVLESKETEFSNRAQEWNKQGNIALSCSVVSAICLLIYSSIEFHFAAKDNIDWLFFAFLFLKGLIVITIFGAWARHAYNLGNAYMHESLKRSDRMHAINFGKLYLEVYGNDVSQNDMKSIFENWNLECDSAFTKVRQPKFEPKILDQITNIIYAANSSKNNNKLENEETK